MTKKTRKSSSRKSTRSSTRRSTSSRSTRKKPSTKRSTASRSRSRSTSARGSQGRSSQTLVIAAVVVVIILGGYYLLTGADPLGLFEPIEETPPALSTATPTAVAAQPPGGGGGDWWEVHFTDPQRVNDADNLRGSIPEKLIAYIDKAQDTIHIASFEFNLTPVAEALIRAQKRGIEVQWVTDDEHGIEADEEEGHGQFAMLKIAGIQVRDDERSALMHNKFWIFDGQMVWTGSTNITVNGNFRNNNNVLVLHSPQVAAIYEREFAEMWDGEFGPTSPSTVDRQRVTIDGTPIQILFAAEDEVIGHLEPLVEGAKKSIRIMAFSFTHDALGEAVLARATRDVDVKGIFETRGSETEYSELTRLFCAKVPARQDGNPGTFHHKVLIIDDETVVTGSLNFSDNADESNDENVVVLTNRDIAALYLQEFERRWAEATDPEDIQCKR